MAGRDEEALRGTAAGLHGREAEIDVIRATLDDRGDRVVLFIGDPGIGKSALLVEAARLAERRGALVLRTVGVQAEAQIPFAGLQQLLFDHLDLAHRLPPAQREALLSAFGMSDTGRPELFLIAEAVAAVLTDAAARRTVAIVADDLQWLDSHTNDVLAFVARRTADVPVIIFAATRSGHPECHLPVSRPVELLGLAPDAADELLRASAPQLDDGQRRRIHVDALGNPLALLELPTMTTPALGHVAAGAALSARLEHAFATRTDDLPQATRDIILVAAVDYSDRQDEIMAAASRLHGQPVTTADLAAAADAGILRYNTSTIAFRHPLVRSGVLQHETLTRRHAANAALAEVIEDRYRRTWHRAQSIVGPDDDVAAQLETAAAESVRRGAVLAAIRTLERAAQLTSSSAARGRRLLLAAEYAFDVGREDYVDSLLTAARGTDLTSLDLARMAWLREIFNDGNPGDATRVHELCANAEHAAAAGDIDLALNLLLGAALRCWWADTGAPARAHVAAVTGTIDAASDPRFIATLAVAEPVVCAARVASLLDETATSTDAASLRLYGMAAHAIGDSPRAAKLLTESTAQLREQGRLGLLAHVLSMLVIIRLELGDLGGAVAAVDEGLKLAQDTGQPIWTTGTLVCAARAEAMQGHRAKALDLAARAELAANRQRLNDLLACVQMARGLAQLDAEQFMAAYDSFRAMFDPASASFHQRERFDAVLFLAETARRTGKITDARTILDDLERVATTTPAPLLHAHLPVARALLSDDTDAEALYRAALADTALDGWLWVRGRLLQAFGCWLLGQGRSAEAEPHLDEARAVFAVTGAAGWLRLLDRDLARARDEGRS